MAITKCNQIQRGYYVQVTGTKKEQVKTLIENIPSVKTIRDSAALNVNLSSSRLCTLEVKEDRDRFVIKGKLRTLEGHISLKVVMDADVSRLTDVKTAMKCSLENGHIYMVSLEP